MIMVQPRFSMIRPFSGLLAGSALLGLAIGLFGGFRPLLAEVVDSWVLGRSYAVVIGIDQYVSSNWPGLHYARKDAQAVAKLLRERGFEVRVLYDRAATRRAIVSLLESTARSLRDGDRVLFFFAGHGHTERVGGRDWGYLVPYDGRDTASYISMRELQNVSEQMGRARHQLFIMDACYGGLFGLTRSPLDPLLPGPHMLRELSRRRAREYITAGGKDQVVQDRGPEGHSLFASQLLKAIVEAQADRNLDGFITFSELASYLENAASDSYQTPSRGVLPGHEGGSFIFAARPGARISTSEAPAGRTLPAGRPRAAQPHTEQPARRPFVPTLRLTNLRLQPGTPQTVGEIRATVAVEFGALEGSKFVTVMISASGGTLARQVVLGSGTSFTFNSAGRRFQCNILEVDWASRNVVVTLEEVAYDQ